MIQQAWLQPCKASLIVGSWSCAINSMYTFGVPMLLYTQKVINTHETQFLTIFDTFFDRPTDRPTEARCRSSEPELKNNYGCSHIKLRLQLESGSYAITSMYTFGVLMLLYTQKVINTHKTQFLTIFDIFLTDRPTDRPTYRGQMQKLLCDA